LAISYRCFARFSKAAAVISFCNAEELTRGRLVLLMGAWSRDVDSRGLCRAEVPASSDRPNNTTEDGMMTFNDKGGCRL
jgi:hypothetical protein